MIANAAKLSARMRTRRLPPLVLLLAALAAPGCGSPSGSAQPGNASAVTQPQVLERVDPELSESTSQFLATSDTKLTIVLHIAVRKDGSFGGVKVVRAEPADLPVARAFAEEIAATIPRWRFRPASVSGKPVDAEFDFVMEAQGEDEREGATR